jgi:2,4-dienoyl-CoA reductase-like NADH-dependent reductase (Old Yellow Enzyme family)
MTPVPYPRVASFKTPQALRDHLRAHTIALELDDEVDHGDDAPLAQPFRLDGIDVGNRFCILPMEGWDGTAAGEPSDLTRRRWRNFGLSGAKLIWGGEAVAVRQDGRANPRQLLLTPQTLPSIASLRDELIASHRSRFGPQADRDLFVGLQLTHSGRFSRPSVWDRPEPIAAASHPWLDRRFGGTVRVATDEELDRIADDFIAAARLAERAGFQFVDVKHCHGYLAHELIGAGHRAGRYGGSLDRRMEFLRRVVEGIRATAPTLAVGVRLSAFDLPPHMPAADEAGAPAAGKPDLPGFGLMADENLNRALDDSRAFLTHSRALGVRWICVTAGSPYYCAHAQRPAYFPPVDGYPPPEDPLRGVARQIQATAILKAEFPDLAIVGSAYSYLQEWLPHAAQYNVRERLTDFVGLGRMALSYPGLPADVLAGVPLRRQAFCRTFSDCTTGPRMGLVSGCYPLDPFYKARPEAGRVQAARTAR